MTYIVLLLGVCPVLQQQLDDLPVTILRCPHQGSPAILIYMHIHIYICIYISHT